MAGKFRFETVRRVRELREKEQQREFGIRQKNVQDIVDHIGGIDSVKNAVIDLNDQRRRERFDLRRDFLIQRYLQSLRHTKKIAEIALAQAKKELEKQRQIMIKAMQEREMMDKLYEKFKEESRLEDLREENKRLSEIAIIRYGRDEQI